MLTTGPVDPEARRRTLLATFALSMFACGTDALACEPVAFRSAQILYVDSPPELGWTPVAGTTSYEIEIVARVPEGAVVERRSFRSVETTVDMPKVDASRPTKVSLTVVAVCRGEKAAPRTRTVIVTPPRRCAMASDITARAAPTGRTISWTPSPGVDYEVRVFDAVSGVMTLSAQTTATGAIAIAGRDPSIVAVRPRCGPAIGAASYLFID